MDPLYSTYRSWLLANPKAFVKGVRGFCKQAAAVRFGYGQTAHIPQRDLERFARSRYNDMADDDPDDEKSLWDTMKPWVVGLGGGYLALKAGERWGRFAQKHNYNYGPIKGPILAGLGAVLPKRFGIQGALTRNQANGSTGG